MKTRFILLTLAFYPFTSNAFILDNVEVGTCTLNPSGYVKDTNYPMRIDIDKDIHLSANSCLLLNYSAENLPLIPDVRISFSKLHFHGSGEASQDFQYKDLKVKKGESVSSKWDVENFSLTFYYQPINFFNNDFFKAELGITTDFFDSTLEIKNEKYQSLENENVSTFVPAFHLYFEFQPKYNLSLFTNFDGLSFTEQKKKIFVTGIKYYINSQIYLSTGYRYEKFQIRDRNSTDSDFTTRGYFFKAGVIW